MSHFYLYILSGCLLLTGCVFDIALPGDGGEPAPAPVPDEEKVAISFNSSIDLSTKADASSTLADGVQVVVYAYAQDAAATPTAAAVVSRPYAVSGGNGNLTVTGSAGIMYLAAGNYTFYALSVNQNATPPALTTGSFSETGQLSNQTDYLYCAFHTAITSQPGETQNVTLAFRRLATSLKITIVSESAGDDKVTAAEAPSITFAATNPGGSKITLGADTPVTAGVPVTDKNDYTTVTSTGDLTSGFTVEYILLPMKAAQTIPVTITFPSITFNGLAAQTNKVYTLDITTPDGGFASGNQYTYKVNITGNDIAFEGVSAKPWTGKEGLFPDEDVTED